MNNFPINRMPSQSETVAVAMSGGLDSAVALYLARQSAARVFGVTAIMTDEVSRCCSPEEVSSAARVCAELGVEHHIVDARKIFRREVMDYFCDEYLEGRTPSPCVKCNRYVKFGHLLDAASDMGADMLASGHYARLVASGGRCLLLRGVDSVKDQSYFLSMLGSSQLARACFPVGDMSKDEVRSVAAGAGLHVAGRKESQEVCFVTEGTHGNWLDVRTLNTAGAGDIVDTKGQRLGRHAGIHHYTVGQRRGLGVAAGRRLFVVSIDKARNEVVLGSREEAVSRRMMVHGLRWISGAAPSGSFSCTLQIRYAQKPCWANVRMTGETQAEVLFEEPQFGVAPGQLAAFFDGDEVLGGGWIGNAV